MACVPMEVFMGSTATFCPKFDGSACGAGLVPANLGETEPQLSLYFRQVNIEIEGSVPAGPAFFSFIFV